MAIICLSRMLNAELKRYGIILDYIPKFSRIQSAGICSKEMRDPNIKKPAPWPYEKRKYTFLHGYFEGTVKRFDENTKIIVVDGPIGAGKSSFAKQLAEQFDMLYMPEPTLDRLYMTPYGYDLRKIDSILPPSYKCCDINTYYTNPYHQNVAKFQFNMFMERYAQYIDALAHLLNTGQGIVLERCVYGDFVFLETMHECGYISGPVRELYNDIQLNTLDELMRPHLIIYLDISPEVVLERIKKRNNPAEVNSKVLTKEYLSKMEYYYKQHYLRKMDEHAELLVYDWSNFGDVEVVVEDIERIDFDRFSQYETKMKDWLCEDDWEWGHLRRKYTNKKKELLTYAIIFRPHVSEVHHPGEEVLEYNEIMKKIPGEKYTEGFNPAAGDNVWFKKYHKSYRYSPLRRVE